MDPAQLGVGHILAFQLAQLIHVGGAQVGLLLLLRLPLLHQQNLVGILDGQEIVIPQAAVLPADGVDDAMGSQLAQKGLPAAGLAR